MAVMHQILEWSNSLPDWQSHALGKLVHSYQLSDGDKQTVKALLKASHGVASGATPKAERLNINQLPSESKSSRVVLLGMENLAHVNAISTDAKLSFEPTGLTVVYGDNGAGKSGYVRVLKRACRARDQSEPILPNVRKAADGSATPSADFLVDTGKGPTTLPWKNGVVPPSELSSIRAFDRRCEVAILDEEHDFSFVPHGLGLLPALARMCDELKQEIQTERSGIRPDFSAWSAFAGHTEVSKLVSDVSYSTRSDDVRKLATVSDEEKLEHLTLSKTVKETNPKEAAEKLKRCAQRLTRIQNRLAEIETSIDTPTLEAFKDRDKAFVAATGAAKLAREKFTESGDLLPGTGEDAWKLLFDAAAEFSDIAYPDKPFPHTHDGARCVLCQQAFDHPAGARMATFKEFVKGVAENERLKKRAELAALYDPLNKSDFVVAIDEETTADLLRLSQPVAAIQAFSKEASARKNAILAACKSHSWDTIPSAPASPRAELAKKIEVVNEEALALEKSLDDKTKATMLARFGELDARLRFAPTVDQFLARVELLKKSERLRRCANSLETIHISSKAKELAQSAVSETLERELNAEFKNLGVGTLSVSLTSRTKKGEPIHKLKLNIPQASSLNAVLSEGEQRAIAIGAFLVESRLSSSTDCLILDDPVSSLDTERREKVAARLVDVASTRQVIVFTHDLVFASQLQAEAIRAGVTIGTRTLARQESGYGVAEDGFPFEGANCKDRIGQLKAMHQKLDAEHRKGNISLHRQLTRDAYTKLRLAWEHGVEEVVLNGVVERFRPSIETNRLAGVSFADADYFSIADGMTKCSKYAHDAPLASGIAVPDPQELLQDIMSLENWRSSVAARFKTTKDERKKGAKG